MTDTTPEADATDPAEEDIYTSRLAETRYEFRIRYEDEVLVTCDWETYDRIKKKFPKADGYTHEGREMTAWLPAKEVGQALVPKRSLIWSIIERDATEYERNAKAQRELAEETGNRVAMDIWPVYREVAENMRRIISQWRDNYN
jgi:hypothetical protein